MPEIRQRGEAFATHRLLLLLRDHATRAIYEYAVAVPVFARRKMVVVPQLCGTDDLTAWQAKECNHGRQVLEQRCVIRSERRGGKQRRDRGDQGPSFNTFAHSVPPAGRLDSCKLGRIGKNAPDGFARRQDRMGQRWVAVLQEREPLED